jgi:hypothetical protein
MRPLSAAELLGVWERGMAQDPVHRALTMLAPACPELTPEALARLGIGQRDARLLALREWSFGPRLVSLAVCPACGEQVELTFSAGDIRAAPAEEQPESLSLAVGDYLVRFRSPNSLDLAAALERGDPDAARSVVLARCLLSASQGGEETPPERLPPAVVDAVVAGMAEADPPANVQLALTCPSCARDWLASFDIATYFWDEINAWAPRLLRDVHTLASAYGWREADILALSPWRRHCYLELARG